MSKIEMIGRRFGSLTVKHECAQRSAHRTVQYTCICDCGAIRKVDGVLLRRGDVISCGCLDRRKTKHQEGDPMCDVVEIKKHLYSRFLAFKARKQPVCEEWTMFENFYKWAIENGYQIGEKLHRYDDNEPYSPDNCCWNAMESFAGRISDRKKQETINRWNRTVNVFRKACGLKLFPVAEESEGVDVNA